MIELFSGDETALRFTPVEMRRVHGLDIHPSRIGLKYSHSDVVIQFENGSTAFLEAVTCILETATYTVKVEPTDISLSVYLSRSEPECINWLKRIVFSFFPDIPVRNTYLGKSIAVNATFLED